MTTKIFKIESFQQKTFWLLAGFLLVTLSLYIYLVNNLIFEAAGREALIRERGERLLTIGELEGQYLTLTQSMTVELAYALGFEEAGTNLSFAARTPPLLALGASSGHEE